MTFNKTIAVIQKPITAFDVKFRKRMWKTNLEALWAIFSLMLQVLPEIYNIAVLSNHGNSMLVGGAGLGVMFINMFVYGTFEGMNGAIDTFVAQSFGARDMYQCNLIFNRSRIINTFVFIPVTFLLLSSRYILDLLNQPKVVSEYAQTYLLYQIPGLFAVMQFDTLRRYLQAQGCFDLPTKTLIFTFIFHILLISTVMHFVKYDPLIVCSMTTNCTLFLDYVVLKYMSSEYLERTNYLPLLTGAFDGWSEYLALAIPSAFILCAEWWMYEALTLFAGWLGVVYLATLIIIFNVHNLVYDVSYGLSQAASSQIGRTLAEIGKKTAKKLLKFILMFQMFICMIITVGYYFCNKEIIKIYTDEEEMIQLFVECKYFIIVMFILDSSQIVLGGVIRGIGEQGESSVISFIAYAVITLPLAILFSFWFNLKLQGILLAYICGIMFNTIFTIIILCKSDWELTIDDSEEEIDYEDKLNAYVAIDGHQFTYNQI